MRLCDPFLSELATCDMRFPLNCDRIRTLEFLSQFESQIGMYCTIYSLWNTCLMNNNVVRWFHFRFRFMFAGDKMNDSGYMVHRYLKIQIKFGCRIDKTWRRTFSNNSTQTYTAHRSKQTPNVKSTCDKTNKRWL